MNIDGVDLGLNHIWISRRRPLSGRIAKGVIFLVPVYNISDHWNAWIKMVKALDPMPEKVIFCENNSDDNTLELIANCGLPYELIRFWVKPDAAKGQAYIVVAHARQLLLTRARQLNPDYAIFIDDDMFPDNQDFIEMLMKRKVDIIGGSYSRIFPEGTFVASKWDIDKSISIMPNGEDPINYKKISERIATLREMYPNMQFVSFAGLSRKLYTVAATGGGALMLSRKTLQDGRLEFVPIRHDLAGREKEISEDFGFCILAGTFGYIIYLDGEVRFAHITTHMSKHRPWRIDDDFSF
jgi:glycosyltransferase involved in cell wall biosynthesis